RARSARSRSSRARPASRSQRKPPTVLLKQRASRTRRIGTSISSPSTPTARSKLAAMRRWLSVGVLVLLVLLLILWRWRGHDESPAETAGGHTGSAHAPGSGGTAQTGSSAGGRSAQLQPAWFATHGISGK